ncbi:MAG: hypothetical protein KDD34_01700 [Bdellovibrionales bacterium]|nr:hypothetical protein [Bdellovibrionales bacterium]
MKFVFFTLIFNFLMLPLWSEEPSYDILVLTGQAHVVMASEDDTKSQSPTLDHVTETFYRGKAAKNLQVKAYKSSDGHYITKKFQDKSYRLVNYKGSSFWVEDNERFYQNAIPKMCDSAKTSTQIAPRAFIAQYEKSNILSRYNDNPIPISGAFVQSIDCSQNWTAGCIPNGLGMEAVWISTRHLSQCAYQQTEAQYQPCTNCQTGKVQQTAQQIQEVVGKTQSIIGSQYSRYVPINIHEIATRVAEKCRVPAKYLQDRLGTQPRCGVTLFKGRCIQGVRETLQEAGMIPKDQNGKFYRIGEDPEQSVRNHILEKQYGFTDVTKQFSSLEQLPVGAVLMYEGLESGSSGHAEIFTGTHFCSDFCSASPISKKTSKRRLIGIYVKK